MGFDDLFKAYKKAHPQVSGKIQQEKAVALWNRMKLDCKTKQELEMRTANEIKTLQIKATASKSSMLSFFVNAASKSKPAKPLMASITPKIEVFNPTTETESSTPEIVMLNPTTECSRNQSTLVNQTQPTGRKPALQQMQQEKVSTLESDLNKLLVGVDAGLINKSDIRVTNAKTALKIANKKLQEMVANAERQRKFQNKRKSALQNLIGQNPEAQKKLCVRNSVGRPSLSVDQPDLIKAIVNIATFGSGADERRRSEIIRTCKTLDDLHEMLKQDGFHLSRSATYLRLIPKCSVTREGKSHVTTAPVRIKRSENNARAHHPDTLFAKSSCNALEALASMLGPSQVAFISPDDKARVSIGLTAANKQAPLLMHVDYKVRLADHDFVIAPRHKLIPSVYAGCIIKPGHMGCPSAVTYSGPTYIRIRSGKHESSTASTHAADFDKLLQLQEFAEILRTPEGEVKPIVIISTDGGPDENPRYTKTISYAIDHFEKHNLDAIFLMTQAPGRSAFNRVERRMAPLSHDLAGLILPHETYGTHLNSQGVTVDDALELKNFKAAGDTLAEVWSSTVIDTFPVKAEYVEGQELPLPPQKDAAWYAAHVRESQYVLQVVKCNKVSCCSQMRSSLKGYLHFLPPPLPIEQNLTLSITDFTGKSFCPLFARLSIKLDNISHPKSMDKFKELPYDFACPSVQAAIPDRCCPECGIYHASKKSAQNHVRDVHKKPTQAVVRQRPARIAAKRQRELMCVWKNQLMDNNEEFEWVPEDDVDTTNVPISEHAYQNTPIPVVHDLNEWLANPWTVLD